MKIIITLNGSEPIIEEKFETIQKAINFLRGLKVLLGEQREKLKTERG